MVREVLGQGTLVPEEIYWLTARSGGMVLRLLETPGARVESDTLIVELTNSELELAALEAARELSRTEAELVNLEATLNAERLGGASALATLGSELADAERRARADEELGRRGFLSELEQGQTLGRERELRGRLAFERKRLDALARGMTAQLAAQKAQIERLRSIADFKREEVERLRVRAGVDGVLQELSLEQGQSVAPGALLGKVVRPDRLKAVVRIPETQTRDLQIGQTASIDTATARSRAMSPASIRRLGRAACGVNQDRGLKNRHRTGDAIGLTRTSCLIGFRYTAPAGDQLRVLPVQRLGVRHRAAV